VRLFRQDVCVEVKDRAGRTWVVNRRLVRRPAWRGFAKPRFDATDGVTASSGGGGLGDLAIGVVIVVTIVVSAALVWPVIVLLVELLVAAALLSVRFVLGRWTVVAETAGERNSWSVRGRRQAAALVAEAANALRTGDSLPGRASFESTASSGLTETELAKPPSSGHVRVNKR
jgi:hypothetical protein